MALVASTTGLYMMKTMFARLGVAEQVMKNLSTEGVAAVARFDADMTLQPLSHLIHARCGGGECGAE